MGEGWRVEGEQALLNLATEYFKDIFVTKSVRDCEMLMESIQPCISRKSDDELIALFTEEEILEALRSMAPLKALGKDRFPTLFFQKFWHIVGSDVSDFCLDILNHRIDMRRINIMKIVLIPKLKNSVNMGQFRPFSLCNVIFKIISKVLANRLRKALNPYIDETQGTFVLGQQITDNILVAYELLH